MWTEGSIKVNGSIFHYRVLHVDEPSKIYGLQGGKISKLMLKRNGKVAYNFDRGQDIEPIDEDTEIAVAIMIKEYN